MSEIVERSARTADAFGARVRAVPPDAWENPTPCDGWIASDVVGHLVEWVPAFFGSVVGLGVPDLPPAADDPVAAWEALDALLRGWLADSSVAGQEFDGPMGHTDVATAVDMMVTTDVLIHTWDLARATGLDDTLPDADFDGMVAGMEPVEDALRSSGHYGPRIPVDDDARPQDRLIAFLGRDPAWGT